MGGLHYGWPGKGRTPHVSAASTTNLNHCVWRLLSNVHIPAPAPQLHKHPEVLRV